MFKYDYYLYALDETGKITWDGYLPALFVGVNELLSVAKAVFRVYAISTYVLTAVCDIGGRTKHRGRKQGFYCNI